MQLLKDRVGSGSPAKWLGVGVVMRDKRVDALHELLDACERAATDCLVGDQGEEALDLIEPRTVGRDEVHVPTRPTRQPSLDLGVALVSLSRSAIELCASPSALLRTMRARLLNAAGNERLRANDCNCDRSSSPNTNSAFGLPVFIAVSPFHRYRIGTQD